MTRTGAAGLIAVALLALAAPAVGQQPSETAPQDSEARGSEVTPPAPVELKLPESVTKALSSIATKPPAPVQVRLPEDVTKSLTDIAVALEKPEPLKFTLWDKLLWALAFLFVAAGAVGFGVRNSEHASYLRHQTSEAREKREAIRLGETGAQLIFEDLKSETAEEVEKHKRSWLQAVLWPLVLLGTAGLVGLAILPDLPSGEWALNARQAAWDVLDSNFSTAFAGMWIALIYFWTASDQQKIRALSDFNMVTKEAKRIAEIRKTKADQELFDEYEKRFQAVSLLPFDPPWPIPAGPDATPAIRAFEMVAARATILGQQQKLKISDDQIKLKTETARLENLARPARWLERYPDFLTFVKRLRKDGSIQQSDTDWTNIVSALETKDDALTALAFRSFAAKLEAESRETR